MIKTLDITWIAGLLEGEGCFGYNQRVGYPSISLEMTDSDIVLKAAKLMGNRNVRTRFHQNEKYKNSYRFSVYGNEAVSWMMTLFNLLGERRKQQIEKVLSVWRAGTNIISRNRVTEKQKQEIYERKLSGKPIKEIAKEFNISYSYAHAICYKKEGVNRWG
jgi:hypothetical protein